MDIERGVKPGEATSHDKVKPLLHFIKSWVRHQENCEERTVINISHKRQVCWAAALEKIADDNSEDRKEFKKILNEIMAKDETDEALIVMSREALTNMIKENIRVVGNYCGISAGRHSKKSHKMIFYS